LNTKQLLASESSQFQDMPSAKFKNKAQVDGPKSLQRQFVNCFLTSRLIWKLKVSTLTSALLLTSLSNVLNKVAAEPTAPMVVLHPTSLQTAILNSTQLKEARELPKLISQLLNLPKSKQLVNVSQSVANEDHEA